MAALSKQQVGLACRRFAASSISVAPFKARAPESFYLLTPTFKRRKGGGKIQDDHEYWKFIDNKEATQHKSAENRNERLRRFSGLLSVTTTATLDSAGPALGNNIHADAMNGKLMERSSVPVVEAAVQASNSNVVPERASAYASENGWPVISSNPFGHFHRIP
ncbi:hypothetical protein ACLOJK_001373 [Asimina triloba]